MAKARSEDFKTPECRLSYASGLFKARDQKNEDGTITTKYGCTLIFPKSALQALEKVVVQVIKDEWGDKGLGRAKQGLIKLPFLA